MGHDFKAYLSANYKICRWNRLYFVIMVNRFIQFTKVNYGLKSSLDNIRVLVNSN